MPEELYRLDFTITNKAQCVQEAVFHFAGRFSSQLALTKTPMCIGRQNSAQTADFCSGARMNHAVGASLNNFLNQDLNQD